MWIYWFFKIELSECSRVEFELWCSLCEHTVLEFQVEKIELDDWMQKILYSVAILFVNIESTFVNCNCPSFYKYLCPICLVCYTVWYMHEQHCLMMMCTNGLMHFLCLLSPCWCTRKGQNTYEIVVVCNGNIATLPGSARFGLANVCLMPGLFVVINQNTFYVINLQWMYKTFLITYSLVTCFFL